MEKKTDGNVTWTPADKFYDLYFLFYNDIAEARKALDADGMEIAFDEILTLVLPYIGKHMSKEDEKLFEDTEEIEELQEEYKPNNTESEQQANSVISRKIINLICKKRKRLSKLMADSGMHLPTRITEERPRGMSNDDIVNK